MSISEHNRSPFPETTLDEATEAFQAIPTARTAATLLFVAQEYWHDGMLSDGSYREAIRSPVAYMQGIINQLED